VAFEFDIQNIGTIYTKKFAYNIDYGDGTGSGGYIFENIEPSEAYKLKLNHTYPSLGAYNLTLQIDPNNDISELNETNNILVKKIGLRRL
jgi:subtilase family serine protease